MEKVKYILLIITKNSPDKLKNILTSIKNNKFLSKSEILLIDNSNRKDSEAKNRKLISNMNENKIIYVDKTCWRLIKKSLCRNIERANLRTILDEIELGKNSWDIHHARNAAAIICSALYKESDVIISLDDDMFLSKNFFIPSIKIDYPRGLLLKGSPDLSRLEWMRLYAFLVGEKASNQKNKQDYVFLLTRTFSKIFLKMLIGTYTDILKSEKLKNLLVFPKREELNAGSFFSSVKYIARELYPSWFDNDWFWFERVRKKNKHPLVFENSHVTHLASKKNIFDKKSLRFEEIGKIITTTMKKQNGVLNNEEIRLKIFERKKIIESEIKLFDTLRLKTKNNNDEKIISKIILHLKFLALCVDSINPKSLINQITTYEKKSKNWKHLLVNLTKSGQIKVDLFKLLNQRKIIIFSPHCDDVIFSLGGSIKKGYLKNIDVYDVYNKTNYYLNKSKKVKNITEIRLKEERNALKKVDISPKFLGFNDSTGREYISEKEYLSPLNNPVKDSSFNKIKNIINKIVKNEKDSTLFFPLGLGYNIDHTILFKIGTELIDDGYTVLFYEDVGYDITKNETLVRKYVKNINLRLSNRVFYFRDIEDKLKLCKIYQTQMSEELLKDIKEVAVKRKGERIWSTSEIFTSLNL